MTNPASGASRRTLLKAGALAAATFGLDSLIRDDHAYASGNSDITAGDVAILRFLAAAEFLEADLWEQYAELANDNPAYRRALQNTDPSSPRYATDTQRDEMSHAVFINGFLASIGAETINLDPFRTVAPPAVTGLKPTGRLTNLTSLSVDTSFYLRYRTAANPDFGANPPQIVNIVGRPTIPTTNRLSARDVQLTADAAAYHFCNIEQGGSSLYTSLIPKVSSPTVLQILTAIGPTEAVHFGVFQTSLEGMRGLASDDGSLVFPDLRNGRLQSRSVMPAPGPLIDKALPDVSVIRPNSTAKAGAVTTATALVSQGLFTGQSQGFFDAVVALATAADAATRA